MTADERPTEVTVLAILSAAGGVLGMFTGLDVTILGSIAGTLDGWFGGPLALIGLAALVVGIAELVSAYGLWTLRPWAWLLGIGVQAAGVAIVVLWVIEGVSIVSGLVSVVIAAAILYELWRPAIRTLFGRS
jgi:hypothetical protein